VTVNDPATADWVSTVAVKIVGAARTIRMQQPVPGSEDFSHVLERVPGALAILGTMPPGVKPSEVAPLHSPRMQLDEGALAVGVALYAGAALSGLSASPLSTRALG
jgi:hippurate hydrolase